MSICCIKYKIIESQIDLLKKHGTERIYQDIESGRKRKREELDRMLDQLRKDDFVVVVTLDRLSRSIL